MKAYLLRRLVWIPLSLVGVATVTFILTRIIPASPGWMLAGPNADKETVAAIERELGLDRPLPVQYVIYLGHLIRGDLGHSWQLRTSVYSAIQERLPATVQLAAAAVSASLLLGLPVGFLSAVRANSWVDHAAAVLTFLSLSAPAFWVGFLLLYLFGFALPVLPLGGYGDWRHLVLPAVTVGLAHAPWYARLFRATLLEELRSDFMRTAHAKGLLKRRIILRHLVPNAIRPVITLLGMDFGHFLGGLLVVEAVFAWPGIGAQAWTAFQSFDIPLIMGIVLFAALMIAIANLVVDVTYTLLDPRVRYG